MTAYQFCTCKKGTINPDCWYYAPMGKVDPQSLEEALETAQERGRYLDAIAYRFSPLPRKGCKT